jgi:hypothetical protein
MWKSIFWFVLTAGALVALAVEHYQLAGQLAKTNETIAQLADALASHAHDDTRPRLNRRPYMGGGSACVGKDEMRAIIREEIRSSRTGERLPSAQEPAVEPNETAPSPENNKAFEGAQRLVNNAIGARLWADEQRDEWRTLSRQLTAAQLTSVQGELVRAINSQQLRVVVAGPPF